MTANTAYDPCCRSNERMAYRRPPEVVSQHACTARVLHTLRPFAVATAGPGEFDPFKD
jgi:tRNA-splicing ligase RtcB